jgi:hypothetical protein
MKTSIQSHFRLILFVVVAASVSLALGDDFKTIDGKEYKGATVTRVEPDGVVVKTKTGISKLYFVELPKEVQQRFNYDPQQARAYSAEQTANYDAIQKHEEEVQRQRDETAAQNKPVVIEQQPEQNSNAAVRSQRATPRPTPRYTTVLHELPQTRPAPTPKPPPPVQHPPPSHPKTEAKKTHK